MSSSSSAISQSFPSCIHTPKESKVHRVTEPMCTSCKYCTISSIYPDCGMNDLAISHYTLENLIDEFNRCSNHSSQRVKKQIFQKLLLSKLRFAFKMDFVNEDNLGLVIQILVTEFSKRHESMYQLLLNDCSQTKKLDDFLFCILQMNPRYLIKVISWHLQPENRAYDQETVMLFINILKIILPHFSQGSDLSVSPCLLSLELNNLLSIAITHDLQIGLKLLKIARKTCMRISNSTLLKLLNSALNTSNGELIETVLIALTKYLLANYDDALLEAILTIIDQPEQITIVAMLIQEKKDKAADKIDLARTRCRLGEITELEKDGITHILEYKIEQLERYEAACEMKIQDLI